jgi:purine-binding chemotaxis protein CheW
MAWQSNRRNYVIGIQVMEDKLQLLIWETNGQLYAGDVKYCLEVQNGKKILDVPHSKKYITGIVNLRGDIVTVLDLFVLMEQKDLPDKNKAVIIRLKDNDKQVAVMADSVFEVIELHSNMLESAENHLSEKEFRYIPYIARRENHLILIVNVPELFVIH